MKVLLANSDKCTGCRNCLYACSFVHESVFDPELARIKIQSSPLTTLLIPAFCVQCQDHPCLHICPTQALMYNQHKSVILWQAEKCNHCHLCVTTCPYHAISLDPFDDAVLICDLCNGDPACVIACSDNALQFVEIDENAKKLKAEHVLLMDNFFRKPNG